jgi:tetrahedral aminopeptidase
MRARSLEFLKTLVATPSPSGFEQRIQEVCREYLAPYVDEVYKDVHGNQFAVRNADARLRVLLDAHVDEVGLMVNHIDDKGFLRFAAIGGVDPVVLSGQRVVIHAAEGPVPGVIGHRPPHLTPAKERGKALKQHEMWIDIAARDRKDAEKSVSVGDPITINVGLTELRGGKVTGRGFDDRVGAFVIIEAMRLLAKRGISCAVFCMTSVQEEVGTRGARTGTYAVEPQAALAVEFGWTTDHPKVDPKQHGERYIDKGPLISRGPNINPVVERQLVAVAKRHKIPYQMVPEPHGTPTNANPIQLSRGGVATGLIRVPGRYLHSPVELLALRDVEWASKLVAEWVTTLKPGMRFIP